MLAVITGCVPATLGVSDRGLRRRFDRILRAYVADGTSGAPATAPDLDAAQIEALRSLGYVR